MYVNVCICLLCMCVYACMYGWMYACMHVHACMHVEMDLSYMYVLWMYVHICVDVSIICTY